MTHLPWRAELIGARVPRVLLGLAHVRLTKIADKSRAKFTATLHVFTVDRREVQFNNLREEKNVSTDGLWEHHIGTVTPVPGVSHAQAISGAGKT